MSRFTPVPDRRSRSLIHLRHAPRLSDACRLRDPVAAEGHWTSAKDTFARWLQVLAATAPAPAPVPAATPAADSGAIAAGKGGE